MIKRIPVLLLLILCLSVPSCSVNEPSPTDILFETLSVLADHPSGDVFFSGAEEYSGNYAEEEKLTSLYAGVSPKGLYSSYALFLCRDDRVYEIHIYKAASEAEGLRLQKLMDRRKDMLQSGDIYLYDEENYEDVICAAKTLRRGVYVILLLTDDNTKAEKTILGMI